MEMLAESEINTLLPALVDWQLVEEDGLSKLRKTYQFTDYLTAMGFANKLADLAEREFHHPDMLIKWGSVTITWWSHEIKGLDKKDFDLAERTDQLI